MLMRVKSRRFDGAIVRYSRADLWGLSARVHEMLLAERRLWLRGELVIALSCAAAGVDQALDYLEGLGLARFCGVSGMWSGNEIGYEIV